MSTRLSVGLLAVLSALLLRVGPAAAQDRPRLPSEQQPNVQASSQVSVTTLPPVDVSALRAKDRQRKDRISPYRYGKVVDTSYRPDQHGTWERLSSGNWLWRLRIRSEEAVSLSLGFTQFQLPDDASLFVYNDEKSVVHGPYAASDATNGEHWTPVVQGNEIIVELKVSGSRPPDTGLTIGKVVHGYRSLSAVRGPSSKSGACNIDVACDEADAWSDQVRSVGGYTLTRDSESLFCSGALVNNTAENKKPLFLTAEHCVSEPSTASSMVFYWNFQTSQCRSLGSDENGTFSLSLENWNQTSTGGILRARYGNPDSRQISGWPDLTIVKVDDSIPPEYGLFLSGWNREDVSPTRGTTIHHPIGHGKRISFDEDPATTTAYLKSGGGDTHLRIGDWEHGTTESGSSGSPLFNPDRQIVGVLSGGFARCVSGTAEDNDEPDWYGRLEDGFNEGNYEGRLISDVLDPENTGTKALNGQPLVPPPPVTNVRITNVTRTSATLRWDAPKDDPEAPDPTAYDVRFRAEQPIKTNVDFEEARRVADVPAPGPAGTTQSVTVSLNPDTSYYFGIRTRDDAKNSSPLATAGQDATPVTALRVKQRPYPNPAEDRVKLAVSVEDDQTVQTTIYDLLGRRVGISRTDDLTPFRRQTITLDVSSLSSGAYFLRIQGESRSQTEKIVITK